MAEHINYDSLLILAVLGFITPIIINSIKKIKIPFVVGEIFVGIIFGKSFLNLIQNDIWISFLSDLGLAYLMFLSGLEIEIDKSKTKEEKKAGFMRIVLCLAMFGLSLLVSFLISKFLFELGLIKKVSFFTVLFMASAPGLVVPFLKERDLLSTDFGQTVLIYSLIGEFTCLISLTIISSTLTSGSLSYKSFLFVIVFIISFLIYKAAEKILKKYDFSTESFRSLHLGVRAAFALILVLVTISHKTGTEIILGSFLAGLVFALTVDKSKEDLKFKLDIIGYGFLIPIFFIMVGVNLDIGSIFKHSESLMIIPALLIIIFVVKLLPSLLLKFTYGLNNSIAAGFLLTSQLSLLIVGSQIALNLNLISNADYSAFILTTVISCIVFPLCFDKIFKYDGIAKSSSSSANKVCIREFVPTNESIFNKPLSEVDFPNGCRIFLIIRNGVEIIPNGNTEILKGDRIVIAGLAKNAELFIKTIR